MSNTQLLKDSARNAGGIAVYVALVSALMNSVERIGGPANKALGGIAFLMLFVFSAAVTGTLFLGQPLALFLQGNRREGISLLAYTLGWLFVLTVAAFVVALSF